MSAAEIHRSKVVLKMKTKLGVGIVLGALWVFACSEAPVDIGDENTRKTGETLSDYEGSWAGYAEAYTFEFAGRSDRVRLLLDGQGNGSLQVGEGAASIPAVDPAIPISGPWSTRPGGPASQLIGGYRYTLNDLRVEDRRLRFTLDPFEPIQPWCQVQTPEPFCCVGEDLAVVYRCHLRAGGNSETGCAKQAANDTGDTNYVPESVPIDCGAATLCESACSCTETSCDTTLHPAWSAYQYTADLALDEDGTAIVGTLVVRTGADRPVQLRLKL